MGDVHPFALKLTQTLAQRMPLAAILLLLVPACAPTPMDPRPASLPFVQEGEAALSEGDSERAIAAYQLALAIAPEDSAALRGLLRAQIAGGDGEAALETLAWIESGAVAPVDPCPSLALAVAGRLGRGAADHAEGLARRGAREGCPGAAARLSSVLVARAVSAREAGEADAALGRYREAISLDSSVPASFVAAAELLIADGRVSDSVALLASGLEQHPDDRALRDLMVRALSIR